MEWLLPLLNGKRLQRGIYRVYLTMPDKKIKPYFGVQNGHILTTPSLSVTNWLWQMNSLERAARGKGKISPNFQVLNNWQWRIKPWLLRYRNLNFCSKRFLTTANCWQRLVGSEIYHWLSYSIVFLKIWPQLNGYESHFSTLDDALKSCKFCSTSGKLVSA